MKKTLLCIALLMSTTVLMATGTTLQVSSNGRYIENTGGNPVFLQNDWANNLPQMLSTTDADTYLDARKAQGFNMISFQAVYDCDTLSDYANQTNIYGLLPFETISSGDYSGRWDVTKPVEGYWSIIDTIIDSAAAKGLYVGFAPLPTSGLLLGGYHTMDRGDAATCYAFANWVGKRYATKTNVIWLAGLGKPANDWTTVTNQVNAIAKGIADGVNGVSNNVGSTDYSTTFMGFYSWRWTYNSSHWFHNESWLDFNAVVEVPGSPTPDPGGFFQIPELTNDYALTPVKPTWLMGPIYENQRNDGSFKAEQSRFQAWQSVLAGGLGITYGDRKVSEFGTDWNAYVTSDAGSQMQYLTQLISPIISKLVPDQSLLVGDTGEVTGDSGNWYWSKSTLIQAARTSNSTNAVIYSAGGLDITVNMSKLADGTMSANWYNPRIGDWTLISNTIQSGLGAANVTFNPPGGESEGNDWVLVLDLVAGPAPKIPAIYITNQNAIVSNNITDYSIGGTNNENVVGTMIWSNQLTLAGGNIPATQSWTISGIALNPGDNVITVSGTNVYGNSANVSVTITRRYLSKIALRVSDNKRFIVNLDGTTFCPQNDWANQLPQMLSTADADTYLDARKAQGFNMISFQAVYDCDTLSDYANHTNIYGLLPFEIISSGDYSGRWDVTKPVEGYWSIIDAIIDSAAAKGLYVGFAPLPTSGLLLGGYHTMDRGDADTCYAFANWVGKRYAHKTNIIWLAGLGKPANVDFTVTDQVNAIAKGIADGVNGVSNNVGTTDYTTTFMGFYAWRWTYNSSHWFGEEDWLDFNTVVEVPGGNTDHGDFYQIDELTNDYALTPVKPTWLMGPIYENQRSDGSFNAIQSRFQAYQSVLAGGFGVSYGNRKVADFDTNWNVYVTSDAGSQMHYLTELISPVLADLVPDQSLLAGDTGEVTKGAGSDWYWSKSTIIQAARTSNSTNAIIYSAGGLDITVKMHKLASGTMSAYWYCPQTGSYTFISNTIDSGLASPNVTFNTPDLNDWVLVLNLEEIPEPTVIISILLIGLALFRRK